MRLSDGTLAQRALFLILAAVALFGLGIAVADKFERLGTANVGFLLDDTYLSPARRDTSQAGLRGGGRALRSRETVRLSKDATVSAAHPILGATNRSNARRRREIAP